MGGAEQPFDKANGNYLWHNSTVYRQEAGNAIIRRAGAAWHLVADGRAVDGFDFAWEGKDFRSTAMVCEAPCGTSTCTVRKVRFENIYAISSFVFDRGLISFGFRTA